MMIYGHFSTCKSCNQLKGMDSKLLILVTCMCYTSIIKHVFSHIEWTRLWDIMELLKYSHATIGLELLLLPAHLSSGRTVTTLVISQVEVLFSGLVWSTEEWRVCIVNRRTDRANVFFLNAGTVAIFPSVTCPQLTFALYFHLVNVLQNIYWYINHASKDASQFISCIE